MKLHRSFVYPLLLAALFAIGGATAACPKTPPQLTTPASQHAYQADQVVQHLTEISNVIKGGTGTKPGQIKPADAFTIIEWISGDANHKDAAGNLAPTTGLTQVVETTVGQGWKAAAKQGWTGRIRALFLKYTPLAPYVDIVDALLEVV